VSQVIAFDIARYVFGSDAEFRRRASVDKALQSAIALAQGTRNQTDLLRKASARAQTADSLATR
jgi:hypothetical protein